jgi:hypothetical protein
VRVARRFHAQVRVEVRTGSGHLSRLDPGDDFRRGERGDEERGEIRGDDDDLHGQAVDDADVTRRGWEKTRRGRRMKNQNLARLGLGLDATTMTTTTT